MNKFEETIEKIQDRFNCDRHTAFRIYKRIRAIKIAHLSIF